MFLKLKVKLFSLYYTLVCQFNFADAIVNMYMDSIYEECEDRGKES